MLSSNLCEVPKFGQGLLKVNETVYHVLVGGANVLQRLGRVVYYSSSDQIVECSVTNVVAGVNQVFHRCGVQLRYRGHFVTELRLSGKENRVQIEMWIVKLISLC